MKQRQLFTALKYLVAFGVLYWMWNAGMLDIDLIKKALTLETALTLVGLLFVALIANFIRFYWILSSQNFGVSLGAIWKVYWVGLFFNFLVPGGTGGDVVKAYYLLKGRTEKRPLMLGAIVYDRFIGLFTMTFMSLVAMLLRPEALSQQADLSILFTGMLVVFLGLGLLLVCIMYERGRNLKGKNSIIRPYLPWKWLDSLYGILTDLIQFRSFLVAFICTLICQGLIVYFLILAGEAAGGVTVDRLIYFIVAPIGFMVMAVPIAPGGLGVGQAAFNVLHQMYAGIGSPIIVTAITIYQMLMFLLALQGFIYYLFGWENNEKVHSERVEA